MNRAAFSRLVLRAHIFLWRLGWAWPLAAVVALLAMALYLGVLVPAREALAFAKVEREQLSAFSQAQAAEPMPTTEVQQLEILKASLISSAEAAELIQRLNELARAEQIALTQSEYQAQRHAETGLMQLRITQPVKAAYPQLKRYAENVLRTVPNVSLDHVAARRDNVGQAQLDVRLHWTFWIQPAEAVK